MEFSEGVEGRVLVLEVGGLGVDGEAERGWWGVGAVRVIDGLDGVFQRFDSEEEAAVLLQ